MIHINTKSQIAQNLPHSCVLGHCVSESDGLEYLLHILPSGTQITFPEIPDPAATPQLVEHLRGGMTFQVPVARKYQYAQCDTNAVNKQVENMLCRQTAFPCSHRCLISLRAHPKQFCSAILLFFSFFFPNCHALQIFGGALPSSTNFWCSHSPRKERVKFEVASYAGARLGKGDQ